MDIQINQTKYNDILNTAANLFWKHGIRRITVEEICREAGVSKMTFYRQFENKSQLAFLVLKGILNTSMVQYRNIMKQEVGFPEKVKQIILLKHNSTNELSEELLNDIYRHPELGLKTYIEEFQQQMMKEVMNDMANAQKQGWIRQDLKLDFIVYMLNDLNKKMLDDQLVSKYGNSREMIMELTNFFFYGIMNHHDS